MGRRKREPRSAHRKRITAAASALFLERGAEAVSVDEIARAAGYSKATLYRSIASGAEEMRMTGGRTALMAAGVCLLAGLVFGGAYLKRVADYQRAVWETAVEEVGLARVADGTYAGEYDVGFVYARVEKALRQGL